MTHRLSISFRAAVSFAAAALLAGASLTACSSNEEDTTSTEVTTEQQTQTETEAKAENAAGTRTITDAQGNEVEIPNSPQHVVTLSEPTLDAAIALGVKPAGSIAGRGQKGVPGYLAEDGGDIPILGTVAEPNFEEIGKAAPDLILVDGTSGSKKPDVMEALRQIAPVVYTGDAGGEWRVNFRKAAEALNKSEEAEKFIADYEKRAEELGKKLEKDYSDKTFSIVRWQKDHAGLILKELPAGQALTDLGLKRPESQDREGPGHSEDVSNENIEQIDADYIFFGSLSGSSQKNPNAGGEADAHAAGDALEQAKQIPGFDALKAAQDDHIIPVDGSLWTSTGGPVLMSKIVDNVEEELL